MVQAETAPFPWGMSLVLSLTMFVMGSDLNIVAPLLVPIGRSLGQTVGAAGLLVTVFAFAYAVASPVIGWLSDRWPRPRVLYMGLATFIVMEFASAWAPGFAWELASRAGAGVAAAAVSPVGYAILGDMVPYLQRGRAMAIASLGFSSATVAGVPLGLWLSQWWDWRGVLVALGLLAIFVSIVFVVIVQRARLPFLIAPSPVPRLRIAPPHPSATARGVPVFGASFLAFMVFGLVYTYLSVDLQRHWHVARGLIALILLVYGLAGIVGNIGWGWLGDRYGKVAAIRLGQMVEVGALVAIAVVSGWLRVGGSLGLPLFVGAIWLWSLSQSYIPNLKALASRVPRQVRGRSLAWNNSAMYGGLMVGSWAASLLYLRIGYVGLLALAASAIFIAWTVLAGQTASQAST